MSNTSALSPDTRNRIGLVAWGLSRLTQDFTEALTNKRPEFRASQYEVGPFAQALARLALIAETGEVGDDQEAAREDVFFILPLIGALSPLYTNAVMGFIQAARVQLADLCTEEQAAELLGIPRWQIKLEVGGNNLHPLYHEEHMYLDRHEVARLKVIRDRAASITASITAESTQKLREQHRTRGGERGKLSPLEQKLYRYLQAHAGQLCPRAELMQAIWGEHVPRSPDALEQLVKHIRAKIEAPEQLVTVRGEGYYLLKKQDPLTS